MKRIFAPSLLSLLIASVVVSAIWERPVLGQAAATQPGPEMISLQFPPNTELKVLIQYVGDRLGINFIYDEQTVSQKITIVTPVKISKDSLLGLLESVMKLKGLIVVDGDQPGWKKILPIANLISSTQPSTRPMQPGQAPTTLVMQVFALRYVEPQKAETVIKPFLTQPGGNSLVLPEQHLLVVTDFASAIERAAALIHLLDQPPAEVDTHFVSVKNLDVAILSVQLQQILAARDKQRAGTGAAAPQMVEVLQDNRTNQLILIGPPERVTAAEAVATSLDVPLPMETKTYSLKTLSPERLDKLIKALIDPLDAKHLYQSATDKESGLLVVTTTPAIHKTIESLKQQLDVAASVQVSPIRFYKLTNTTAADVLATIHALEGGEESTNTSSPPSIAPTNPIQIPGMTTPAPPLGTPGQVSPVGTAGTSSPGQPGYAGSVGHSASAGTAPAAQNFVSVHTAKGTITADPNTNTIIVEADPATQTMYEGLIQKLDKRRPQVLIECTLVTLDTSDNFSLGVELGGKTSGTPQIITFNSFGLSTPNPSTGVLTLTPGPGFNGTLLNSSVAQVVIQALQTNSKSKVLSAPRILVNDNATGTLSSVAEQPFTSVNASNTVSTTSFGGYATAGTTITLTPHISEGDHMQLEYNVTLNNFTGQSSNGIPPPRQTDTVQSKITIPDDSTIVVGGLTSSNFSEGRQTIPFLGDIPLLKELVSQHNHNEANSTLFVFIRPVILRDDLFADLKYFSQRDAKAAGLKADFPPSVPLLMR